MSDIDLSSILTKKELSSLEKINKKIEEHLNKICKEMEDIDDGPLDFADKHPEVIHKEHITDCPHEMRITVEAKISSIDNKGYLTEVKDLTLKHFHIPIPSQTNYVNIAEKFFEKFEKKLYETCTEEIKPLFKDVKRPE